MARIFITGSADGLGQMAAASLIKDRHEVFLHARSSARGKDAQKSVPNAEGILFADLSDASETRRLADELNALGRFDTIIHNAGVYNVSDKLVMAVNTLAPYMLTCLVKKPARLIYLSSDMHMHGDPKLESLSRFANGITYSDSKLYVVMLAMAVARKWPMVYSNAVDPGWVPTKMGGSGAPDNLAKGSETQAWLAVSEDDHAKVSGRHFYHKKESSFRREAGDVEIQERLLAQCAKITGVKFPD
ncbi:MAG: SDR family NAD(P)-dependent oxidoreductase [Chryseolinea sp.]